MLASWVGIKPRHPLVVGHALGPHLPRSPGVVLPRVREEATVHSPILSEFTRNVTATTRWCCSRPAPTAAPSWGSPCRAIRMGIPPKTRWPTIWSATSATLRPLPVLTGTGIRSLTRLNGGFCARTDADVIIDARAVVLATGAFQKRPAISRQLSPEVLQLTPESYKRPGQLPSGRVLVVGDGAPGRQTEPWSWRPRTRFCSLRAGPDA